MSMHLSRVELPWEIGRDHYGLHRRLWQLFPGAPREPRKDEEDERQGFLFRVEVRSPGRPVRLLLQSRETPGSAAGVHILGTRRLNPSPAAGQTLAFLLTANPIRTIKDAERDAKPGKSSVSCRVPLLSDEERLAWLRRKLKGAAEVLATTVTPHEPIYFRKGRQGGKLVMATFEGRLKVLEPDRLRKCIRNGVGPAKGFGCGLMLLRRAG
jgi:CRISPR system Cascade subunit CasE